MVALPLAAVVPLALFVITITTVVAPVCVPVIVSAPVATATGLAGPVMAAVWARATMVVATASRRKLRKRFKRFTGAGYFLASLPPRVRGSALAGVTMVGF